MKFFFQDRAAGEVNPCRHGFERFVGGYRHQVNRGAAVGCSAGGYNIKGWMCFFFENLGVFMMKFTNVLLGLIFSGPVLLAGVDLKAQNTAVNLYELECQSKTPQLQNPLKLTVPRNDVRIGEDNYDEVAYLHNKYLADFGDVLDRSEYGAEVTCKLPTGVSQLNLAFGLDKDSDETDNQDMVVLEVYADRKLIDQTYMGRHSEIQQRSFEIANSQNVTLKATCVNRVWWNNCPRLSFMEMRVN